MDLRACLNAISDVVANRPPPLREFDQIYMKFADMLIQAEHVSKWVDGLDVVFIGDGDALALCLMHLHRLGEVSKGPRTVHVLDFDQRVVNSVHRFAERYGYGDCVSATVYNVAEPLPIEVRGRFGAFYTNPPFGGSNGGMSLQAFIRRGTEALVRQAGTLGCVVLADDRTHPWCAPVLRTVQRDAIDLGFVIAELVPRMHTYHLDDSPDLTSCSLILERLDPTDAMSQHAPLTEAERANFYGRDAPLNVRYVRDLRNGGKFASHDHELVPFDTKDE